MLTLASASMFGYEGDHHIKLATSVEFMHTATLLHDDVVDESDLRRGKSTARRTPLSASCPRCMAMGCGPIVRLVPA